MTLHGIRIACFMASHRTSLAKFEVGRRKNQNTFVAIGQNPSEMVGNIIVLYDSWVPASFTFSDKDREESQLGTPKFM